MLAALITPLFETEIPVPAFSEVSLSCFVLSEAERPVTALWGTLAVLITPAPVIEIPVPAFSEVSLSCFVAAEAETAI